MASSVKSDSDKAGDDRVAQLENRISELTALVQDLQANQHKLPMAKDTESIIAEALKDGTARRTRDLQHPQWQDAGFQKGDVVRYREGSPKYNSVVAWAEKVKLPLPMGVVKNYMYTTKAGQRKYKVDFPKWGQDGCTEDELELVR